MQVSYDISIMHNNGIENAVFVEGLSAELFRDRMVEALVSYQIFVIGRQQKDFLAAAFCPAVLMYIIYIIIMAFCRQFAGNGVYGIFTFTCTEVCPPYKVFQCGRRMAAEILSCKQDYRFFM